MNNAWIITPGTIAHRGALAFSAQWRTGVEMLEEINGLCWVDEAGGNETNTIVLFGFQWAASQPDQTRFESLMQEAVLAVDHWIMSRV